MTAWVDFESASPARILDWAADQPWARAMADCGQDSEWHAEGDVWTHTQMVVDELTRLEEWSDLDSPARLQLIFTALFHDAGKPTTTRIEPESGRTRSPKHAVAGMELCRKVLRDLGCGLTLREEVANLVRYHGRPAHLFEKDDPACELISLSWVVNHRLLHLFALADTRGRKSKETTRPEETIHLWKMVAQETGCFDRPYPFRNDQARFLFFRDALSDLYYIPRENHRCTATLLSGLPGSGKDAWLTRHRPDLPVVSLDDVREVLGVDATDDQGEVIQAAREKCREFLRAGQDFAFNATNTMKQTRKRWIDLFASYDARIEVIYLEPPLDVIHRRNERRLKAVPRRAIERLVEKLEPPLRTEAHFVSFVD